MTVYWRHLYEPDAEVRFFWIGTRTRDGVARRWRFDDEITVAEFEEFLKRHLLHESKDELRVTKRKET